MVLGLWNQNWLEQNASRSYPLTEASTCFDTAGAFRIPDDFIVGLYLSVHSGLASDPSEFYIHSISVFSVGASVVIGYNGTPIAMAAIPRSGHERNDSYSLVGLGEFLDTTGQIAIGMFEGLDTQPHGTFYFNTTGAGLDFDVVRPILRGVAGLTIDNNGEVSDLLYGDIELVAGRNIRLTLTYDDEQRPQIRIDAIEGEGLSEDCVCDISAGDPIRRINGVGPDETGNINLLGDDCAVLTALTNGLKISDECSKACCGCEELSVITTDLRSTNSGIATVRGFVNRLGAQIDVFSAVLLGSRISDEDCGCSIAD